MSSVCIFNQTDREIEELEIVEKVLMSAIEKEKLVNTSFNLIIVDNNRTIKSINRQDGRYI